MKIYRLSLELIVEVDDGQDVYRFGEKLYADLETHLRLGAIYEFPNGIKLIELPQWSGRKERK